MAELFDLTGKVAAVTGGGGVLCGAMSRALGRAGARVAVLDLKPEAAEEVVSSITSAGGEAVAVEVDVLDRASVQAARDEIMERFGRVDILINGAGGNKAQATTSDQTEFFDLDPDAVRWVFDLNFLGTFLPSQVFGKDMADAGTGVILNISSMSALQPLTRVPAYSAAKAAVSNFTQWLAVHMSQNHSKAIRVNAMAPGFFLTEQNKFLLIDESSGDYTDRGRTIVSHTPMDRLGDAEDLVGTMLWLVSDAARFVHGVVVPIDGGFSAFSGV
jgi:NAD(P)-dependent dehydrogenase (short-subunit alcohol dehydrogenase family)